MPEQLTCISKAVASCQISQSEYLVADVPPVSESMNDRLLKALRREPVDCTPIWIMRQAGRYLPEYRETRASAGDFLTLCKTPELACEVTLQPLARFDLDAAILFSDILTIPDAMGLGLTLNEGIGPRFDRPVRSVTQINDLPVIDVESELGYVFEAVRLIRKKLNNKVPLIGFSGSPWTLATYMVEGGGSKEFGLVKGLMHDEPRAMHTLLEKTAVAVQEYLIAQARAGAQVLMLFDTWGGVLSSPDYLNFSLHYMKQIIAELKRSPTLADIPIILFTKGGGMWLEDIAESGCHGIGINWTVPLAQARERVGSRVALQGNLDPTVLYASEEKIEKEVVRILGDYGTGPGHVFNLGHGIHPGIDPERVKTLVQAVHRESKTSSVSR